MELEQDSGYMCSKCYLPILESVLVFNEEKIEFYHKRNFYHKECEK